MKKKLSLFILFISFFLFTKVSNAETFFKGEYISGEYVNRVKNGKVYYATVQYFLDSNGGIVYCIEPFETLENGSSYKAYEDDLTEYKNLTEEQKRKISLIIYYGYGYENHTQSWWYVTTQFLVWRTIAGEDNVYFTDTLNGRKVDKYEEQMQEILNNVNKHDKKPDFVRDYYINLNGDFTLKELNGEFELVDNSSSEDLKDGLKLYNLTDDTIIKFRRKSNYYQNRVAIYENNGSQDLIKPGNVTNQIYEIPIHIQKGHITLNLYPDDSVYTVESNFTDTCYELIKDNVKVQEYCSQDNKSIVYITEDLPYGEYIIKQTKVGEGYKEDSKIYKVSITDDNKYPVVHLYNSLIRNNIEITKYACKEELCDYELGAEFSIFDKNGNLVKTITTNENGYTNLIIGYGTYEIKQTKGVDNYSLADTYKEKIVDETTEHKKDLYNYYLLEEEKEEPEIVYPKDEETALLPPHTGLKSFDISPFLLLISLLAKKIIK